MKGSISDISNSSILGQDSHNKLRKRKLWFKKHVHNRPASSFKTIEHAEIESFVKLLNDDKVRTLFEFDICCKMADNVGLSYAFPSFVFTRHLYI